MNRTARRTLLAGAVAGLLTATLGLAASPALATVGASDDQCRITTLPYPADTYRASADAIDPTGRYVAGAGRRSTPTGNEPMLLVWSRGQLTTVDSPLAEIVTDVNVRGVVIGNGFGDGVGRPWRYRAGVLEPLPTPAGGARTVAINRAGDIVGFGQDPATGDSFGVLWPAARPGTVEVLSLPANAVPGGIADDGTIVGTAGAFDAWTAWIRRPDGRVDPLTVPGAAKASATGLAGRYAIGFADLGYDTGAAPVRWNLRDGSYTDLATQLPWLEDVNARGVVIGGEWVSRGSSVRALPGGGDRMNIGATAIADTGTIVGYRRDGLFTPVRWTGC